MKRGYAKRWHADGLMQAYGKLRLSMVLVLQLSGSSLLGEEHHGRPDELIWSPSWKALHT